MRGDVSFQLPRPPPTLCPHTVSHYRNFTSCFSSPFPSFYFIFSIFRQQQQKNKPGTPAAVDRLTDNIQLWRPFGVFFHPCRHPMDTNEDPYFNRQNKTEPKKKTCGRFRQYKPGVIKTQLLPKKSLQTCDLLRLSSPPSPYPSSFFSISYKADRNNSSLIYLFAFFFVFIVAEVTIKQLKERVRQSEEALQNTVQVSARPHFVSSICRFHS